MVKTKNRLLSLLLCIVMICTTIGFPVYAKDDYESQDATVVQEDTATEEANPIAAEEATEAANEIPSASEEDEIVFADGVEASQSVADAVEEAETAKSYNYDSICGHKATLEWKHGTDCKYGECDYAVVECKECGLKYTLAYRSWKKVDKGATHTYDESSARVIGCKADPSSFVVKKCTTCDMYILTGNGIGQHDWGDWTTSTGNSCIETTYRERVCRKCQEKQTEQLPSTGHQWKYYTTEVTCTSDGKYYKKCTVCDAEEIISTIPALGHSWCKDDGDCTTAVKCARCDVELPAKDSHNWSTEWSSDGTKHWHACTNKGCTKRSDEAVHTGKTASDDCTAPTVCDICEHVMQQGAYGTHNWSATCKFYAADKHAYTCTNPGCKQVKLESHYENLTGRTDCTTPIYCVCGAKMSDGQKRHNFGTWRCTDDTHEHKCLNRNCQYVENAKHVAAANDWNCTTAVLCKDCKAVMEVPTYKEHEWGPWVSDGNGTHTRTCLHPDCLKTETEPHYSDTAAGNQMAVCKDCGVSYGTFSENDGIVYATGIEASQAEISALEEAEKEKSCNYDAICGHKATLEWKKGTDIDADCVSDECEYAVVTCGTCELQYVLAYRGCGKNVGQHNFDESKTKEYVVGCEKNPIIIKMCETCGLGIMSGTGSHKWSDWNEYPSTTCAKQGYKERTCEDCGATQKEMFPAISHKWEEYTTTATCTQDGEKYKECTVCHKKVTISKTPALGHSKCPDDGNCETAEKCSRCGAELQAAKTHNWDSEWSTDGTNHWHACTNSGCTKRQDEGNHTGEVVSGDCTAPTTCAVCGYTMKQGAYGSHNWSDTCKFYAADKHAYSCTNPGCKQVKLESHCADTSNRTYCTDPIYCVCGVKMSDGQKNHNFGTWRCTDSTHVHKCLNRNCQYGETAPHVAMADDGNCTTAVMCSVCKTGVATAAYAAHAWGAWVDNGDGTHTRTCTHQGCTEKQTVSHTWGAWTNHPSGSCTKAGYRDRKCKVCGAVEKETIAAAGHKWETKTTTADCTHAGESYKQCSVCGEKSGISTTPALGHAWGKDDGDCTTPVKCTRCAATKSAKSAHKWSTAWSTDGTSHWHACTNAGCTQRKNVTKHTGVNTSGDCTADTKCSVCGYVTAHGSSAHAMGTWKDNGNGTHTRTCTHKGCTKKETVSHQWGAWTNHPSGSCTKAGYRERKCKVCGAVEKETIAAAGHKWETKTTTADCTHAGESYKQCSVCGEKSVISTTPALGHAWGKDDGDCTTPVKCTRCAATKSAKGAHKWSTAWSTDGTSHWHACTNAGCTQRKNVTKHTGVNTSGDCTADTKCSVCGYVTEKGYSAHVMGAWVSDGNGTHTRTCTHKGCTKKETAAHSGGTATCNSKAVCKTCGEKYGSFNTANHKGGTEIRNAKEASVGVPGYTGDKYCKGCGKKLSAGSTIPAINAAAPKLTGASNVSGGVKVTWGAVSGVQKYRVYYKTTGSWQKLTDTTSTSYTWKSAKAGTKYTFTVRCLSADGKNCISDYDTKGCSVTTTAATPKITGASNVSGGVKVTWGAVSGVQKYRVYYKTTGSWQKLTDTTSTSYTWKSAKAGTKYTFTVRCLSADGKNCISDYDTKGCSVTTTAATPKITGASNVSGGVKVTWGAVSGVQKYRVYYKTTGSWQKLTDTTSTSYTWKGTKAGTKYTFTVRCLSADGKSFISDYDTKGCSVTTTTATPKLTGVSNVSGGVKIAWGKVSGAAKYRIFYKTGNGSWKTLADTTSTSYTWKSAKAGTKYTFTVRCLSSDSKSYTSSYDTKGLSITTKK